MSKYNLQCNLPLIFNIMKLYKEEHSITHTNKNDMELSAYFKSNYIRMIFKEMRKCIYYK